MDRALTKLSFVHDRVQNQKTSEDTFGRGLLTQDFYTLGSWPGYAGLPM